MTVRIAFLAVAQAHQFLHWLPAALRLAAEPGVEVTVLGSTRAALDMIRDYDPGGRLRLVPLWSPWLGRRGLFDPPKRRPVLLLNASRIARYPTVVTTEVTSSLLRRVPGFRSRMVLIKHGSGDRAGSYNPKHSPFNLILVHGEKHRDALVARGLVSPDRCVVTGSAKLELVRPPERLFDDERLVGLYNPHFDPDLSSWFRHGAQLLDAFERTAEWNFIVAPHVRLRGGPAVGPLPPNILFDPGSRRSIDMTYTQAADVYIGDVSSQVYEFIRRPRPCIFLNLDDRVWKDDPAYAHWSLGQVINSADQLGPALHRATALQERYEPEQRRMMRYSVDDAAIPASERQARAILELARRTPL